MACHLLLATILGFERFDSPSLPGCWIPSPNSYVNVVIESPIDGPSAGSSAHTSEASNQLTKQQHCREEQTSRRQCMKMMSSEASYISVKNKELIAGRKCRPSVRHIYIYHRSKLILPPIRIKCRSSSTI